MNFFSLPPELLVAIVAYLDVPDILAFCCVCRLAQDVFENSTLLQYLVGLFVSGMVDENVLSKLGIRDRLEYLMRRESVWKSLDLKPERRVTIPVEHRHSHIHDLTAGIYIYGELSAIPDSIRTSSLRHVHLPTCIHDLVKSRSAASQERSWWNNVPLGVEALNIGVSLEHNDLLAVLTSVLLPNAGDMHVFQLHLKKFSNSVYHPLAQQPIIQFHEHRIEGNQCIASIDIAGPYLVVLLTWMRAPNTPDELFVYDWMTGVLIMHISSGSFTYRGATFLSNDTFIMTNMRENAIEFLRLKGEAGLVTCRWIGKLALPPLRRGSSLISMNCRTDAIRGQAPGPSTPKRDRQLTSAPSGTSKRAVAPVRCDPDKTIVQFRMYIQGGGAAPNVGHVSLFAFVAHRGDLLRIAEADNKTESGSSSPTEVVATPWDSWGPRSTRWSGNDETDTAWMAGVAGQRQIYITGDRPRRIHVRDYNSATVRKALSPAGIERRQDRVKVVTGEIVTARQGCFVNDVHSSLPFVEVVSDQTFEYDGVLMDESHVIGLTEDEEDGSIRQMDVFIMSPDVPRTCNSCACVCRVILLEAAEMWGIIAMVQPAPKARVLH
ncbi:uncharacterized protein FOMMEDRAFT_166601 [Fomitiporia mediterranea MF3/22]|uniref:uncharacterized protein n=1 Tax=Fomitiporia mediterranea (strain MF3/22) TaxID=694068 RepID=UPI0004409B7C|nr:uncharacterized protein FOMMEDRAFT_166601 [Fomitiporia mediterranea MF3/22]EJD04836.1 hypothetical protein FOMMEDRAFT_166601 [Fomitiporia mediterranea MF3/22]